MIAGVDYGSKLAGTTVFCYEKDQSVFLYQSFKNKDADAFLLKLIREISFSGALYLDAPQSLPLVYRNPELADPDYFYRQCDKEIKAMSPMFLGGLTARAMKLTRTLQSEGVETFEAYPGGLVRTLNLLPDRYKKKSDDLPEYIAYLQETFDLSFGTIPANWHQIDALLAFIVGKRRESGEALQYGNESEGVIYT